nr:hypothetical protein [Fredinandcohnia onubensis]
MVKIIIMGDEMMSSFQMEGQRAVIDIRERVIKGNIHAGKA